MNTYNKMDIVELSNILTQKRHAKRIVHKKTLLERFEAKYIKNDINKCWLWVGATSNYGHFSINGKTMNAHRVSYELYKDQIAEGLVIDHLCMNKLCVNPYHLEAVSNKENFIRYYTSNKHILRNRQCHKGHTIQGHRCKICVREYNKAYNT